jgi:hypothetical protein
MAYGIFNEITGSLPSTSETASIIEEWYVRILNGKFKDTVSCVLKEYFPNDSETNQKITGFIVKEFESFNIFKSLAACLVSLKPVLKMKKAIYRWNHESC